MPHSGYKSTRLEILKTIQLLLLVCIEQEAAKRLRKIIKIAYDLPESRSCKLPTGWRNHTNYTADIKLLRLSHLSIYKLFSRKECEEKSRFSFRSSVANRNPQVKTLNSTWNKVLKFSSRLSTELWRLYLAQENHLGDLEKCLF